MLLKICKLSESKTYIYEVNPSYVWVIKHGYYESVYSVSEKELEDLMKDPSKISISGFLRREDDKYEQYKPMEHRIVQVVNLDITLEEYIEEKKAYKEYPGSDDFFDDQFVGALEEIEEDFESDLEELPSAEEEEYYDFSFITNNINSEEIDTENIQGDFVKVREDPPPIQLEDLLNKKLKGFLPIGVCMEEDFKINNGLVEYRPLIFESEKTKERKFIYISYNDWFNYFKAQEIAKNHRAA